MSYVIRKAVESEKLNIARTIAYSFEKDFSGFAKDMDCLAKALEEGIATHRFIVAEQNGELVGVLGYADGEGRPISVAKKDCRKYMGFFKGFVAHMVLVEEFMLPLNCPNSVGCVDVVGVLETARGQGIAKSLLEEAVRYNSSHSEVILNVTEINSTAIRLYENFGFVEYKRMPYKFAKSAGFKEKVHMRYTK